MTSPLHRLLPALVLCLSLVSPLLGQGAGGGSNGPQFGTDPLLKEIFKPFKAYVGSLRIEMVQQGRALNMEAQLQALNGNTRTEIDLTKLKSPDIPPGSLDRMIELGFNPIVSISTEQEGLVYVIYPKLKAYASQRFPANAAGKPLPDAKRAVTELGEEMVGIYRCAKRRVIFPYAAGKAREVLLWAAKDQKDFPVKVEYKEGGEPVVITFLKVAFDAPSQTLFVLPKDFTVYEDVNSLMQGEMSKSMGEME